jgi:hypothetical protein
MTKEEAKALAADAQERIDRWIFKHVPDPQLDEAYAVISKVVRARRAVEAAVKG